MWGVSLTTTLNKEQATTTAQNILDQVTKNKLSRYYCDAMFSPTKTSLLKALKQGFVNS